MLTRPFLRRKRTNARPDGNLIYEKQYFKINSHHDDSKCRSIKLFRHLLNIGVGNIDLVLLHVAVHGPRHEVREVLAVVHERFAERAQRGEAALEQPHEREQRVRRRLGPQTAHLERVLVKQVDHLRVRKRTDEIRIVR
jgi:hypothetical protein